MTLKSDISQYYDLKAAIEQLLGKQAWLDLKECTSISTWRGYVLKLFDAIRISIEQTIEIRDDAWLAEIHDNLERGAKAAKSAKEIDDLLAVFSATLLRQVFLQVGCLPTRSNARKVTLAREYWTLNQHRSVQVVQTPAQIEAAFWSDQQRRIGVEEQKKLYDAHRVSKSELPFSKWCELHRG